MRKSAFVAVQRARCATGPKRDGRHGVGTVLPAEIEIGAYVVGIARPGSRVRVASVASELFIFFCGTLYGRHCHPSSAGSSKPLFVDEHCMGIAMKDEKKAAAHRAAPLKTPTGLSEDATRDIAAALTTLLAECWSST
ncbi:hypothetical protein P0D69_42570 [Paraburkholderia sediminicola]|uniref:hypothetical protein n=1 Tax=Paraburkholderia sediminicola TaxID=458836 RepID=UPI0038B9834C